jgi:hypothetical protein
LPWLAFTSNMCTPKGWSFKDLLPSEEVKLPPGKYYIGDLCYIMDDDVEGNPYDNVFGGTGYSAGLYTKENKGSFYVANTAYGDGAYKGSNQVEYGVDAGIIGIVNMNLIKEEEVVMEGKEFIEDSGGTIYDFPNGVSCKFNGKGIFEFIWKRKNGLVVELIIDTASLYDDEEDEDDYY